MPTRAWNRTTDVYELTPTMVEPLILEALEDLGGKAGRREVVAQAVELGGFSDAQLAVERKYKQSAYIDHLHTICDYAVWHLKEQGAIETPERGIYVLAGAGPHSK